MNIIKNKFGNIALNVTEPNIIIRLSGGLDSAVLFYILASEIEKHNLNTIIHPINVRKIHNEHNNPDYDKFDAGPAANAIISFVKGKFPNVNIAPLRRKDVTDWWINERLYIDTQVSLVEQISKPLAPQWVVDYSGVTKNPDPAIGQEYIQEIDKFGNTVTVNYNPERHRDKMGSPRVENTVSILGTYDNIIYIDPFRNADKRLTVSLGAEYGILDFLINNTRSCEGRRIITDNFTKTCYGDYKCWWCHEREWALENYDK